MAVYGMEEAGRRHPYEEGKNRGKHVPETSVHRILKNLELHRQGRLIPNGLSEERYGYQPSKVATMNGESAQIRQNPVLSL